MLRRAQAAMEFLMTYGWAILVVLAAIAALAYFGILNPSNILPEKCTGMSGLDCLEKAAISVSANTVTFSSKANLGGSINITSLLNSGTQNSCGADGVAPTWVTVNIEQRGAKNLTAYAGAWPAGGTDTVAQNGDRFVVTIRCASTLTKGRTSADFTLFYNSLDSLMTGQRAVYSIRGTAS
jgi:hypothetical protein